MKITTKIIALAAATLIAAGLASCTLPTKVSEPGDEPASSAPAAPRGPDTIETPTEEPVSAPNLGTLANPAPFSTPVKIKDWDNTTYDVTFTGYIPDANAIVAEANMFNDAAPAGYHYVLIGASVTNTTADASKPVRPGSALYSATLTDQNGTSYSQVIAVIPDDLSGQSEIYTGQTADGNIAFLVPDTTTSLVVGLGGVFVGLG